MNPRDILAPNKDLAKIQIYEEFLQKGNTRDFCKKVNFMLESVLDKARSAYYYGGLGGNDNPIYGLYVDTCANSFSTQELKNQSLQKRLLDSTQICCNTLDELIQDFQNDIYKPTELFLDSEEKVINRFQLQAVKNRNLQVQSLINYFQTDLTKGCYRIWESTDINSASLNSLGELETWFEVPVDAPKVKSLDKIKVLATDVDSVGLSSNE